MTKELTIIQMNDTHGYLEEHFEYLWKGDREIFVKAGGYSRIAKYVSDMRKEKDGKVLFVDGGDTFHGTYSVVKSEGEVLVELLNDLELDAMTAHWDFAYGPEQFEHLVNKLNYPMLAINCYKKENNELLFPPYTIKEINGLKIGIIGIAATIVDKTMPDHFSKGIHFTIGNEELPSYINKLKNEEQVDLVVLASHLGYPQEIKIARQIDGIDVLLSAHTHNRIYEPTIINDTIIIQSGCHGSFLGKLDLKIKNKKIESYKHELVLLDESIEQDQTMHEKVENIMKPHREILEEVLGKTKTDLTRDKVLESTMDNLLLKSLMNHEKDAVMAFSNGWRYGAPIPKGDITVNDLWNIIPVNPPVSTVDITGQELWDMLEENLERTFAKDPFNQMGGYVKRCLGINMYFKIENPEGERVQELFVGNEIVDKDKTYKVVYVTTQGVPKKYGTNRKHLDIHAIDVLKNYIKLEKEVESPLKNNIVAI